MLHQISVYKSITVSTFDSNRLYASLFHMLRICCTKIIGYLMQYMSYSVSIVWLNQRHSVVLVIQSFPYSLIRSEFTELIGWHSRINYQEWYCVWIACCQQKCYYRFDFYFFSFFLLYIFFEHICFRLFSLFTSVSWNTHMVWLVSQQLSRHS